MTLALGALIGGVCLLGVIVLLVAQGYSVSERTWALPAAFGEWLRARRESRIALAPGDVYNFAIGDELEVDGVRVVVASLSSDEMIVRPL